MFEKLKANARRLKSEVYALYLACRDPGTPWCAKILAGLVVAYALSPIDLIPDFIPVLGQLDDLILVPAGIALVLRMVPPGIMASCRERAAIELVGKRLVSRPAAVVVVLLWLAGAVAVIRALIAV
ncbi:MAG: YkvA family protein [Spirochaetes bacterium]|nr:YkvA family protein [Spirochaetota bacterium]